MTNFTFRQLRYFETLARLGHFGRAAEACAISQPAMSAQIKELETTLGLVLFERTARQVHLTNFGAEFAERVRVILRAVDDLGDLARTARDPFHGKLRLGVIPTIAPYLLPGLIGRLTASYPGIDIHIRETLTQKLLQELTAGQLDAAIVALPVAEPLFQEVALFDEDLLLVRPLAEAAHPVPSREDLRDMRMLLLEEGHCFREQALSFCNIRADRPREGLDGTSLTTLVQMVGAGIGVTLIPEMAVPVETRSAPVSVARMPGRQPMRRVGMIWRKSSPLAPYLNQIAGHVRAVAQGAPGEGGPDLEPQSEGAAQPDTDSPLVL